MSGRFSLDGWVMGDFEGFNSVQIAVEALQRFVVPLTMG